jgi:carbon monoxide dehydrogenase subunit G
MMCAMKFRHELSYDAPPDVVFEMLADPEFRKRACDAQDVISADVSLERSGGGFSLVVDQLQKTDDLPSFARTFAGDSTQAIQREEWSDPSRGTLRIEAPGKPTSAQGTITLEPDGSGTREVVELEIKVKVPLIGGKLEKLMAEKVASGMDVEHEVGVAYLKGT